MLRLRAGARELRHGTAVLVGGASVANLIPLALTPVLTRLYSPEEFGLLAIFVAVGAVLGSAANGRYEMAIMIADDEDDAISVAALGVVIAATVGLLVLVSVAIFGGEIAGILGRPDLQAWLFLLPVVVIGTGIFNSLNLLNNRLGNYSKIAKASVVKALATGVIQVTGGLLFAGAGGLILGQSAHSLAANGTLLRGLFRRVTDKARWEMSTLRKLAGRYQDFPKFSLPANLANTSTTHLVNVLLSAVFTIASLGQLSLVQRALGAPSALIGDAVGQIYYRTATKEKVRSGNATRTFYSTVVLLSLVAVPGFLVAYLVAPTLFEVIFGTEWRTAGQYAQAVIPLVAIRFILAPVTHTNNVFEKQRVALLWQLGLLVISLAAVGLSVILQFSIMQYLWLNTICVSAHYVLLFFILRKVARGNEA